MTWQRSLTGQWSRAFPGTRQPTPGPPSRPAYEIPLRRLRSADGLRRATVAWRRDAGGDIQVPNVRPRGRAAHEPDGNAAGLVIGSRDRRQNGAGAAARDRA